jgi:CheY-like chemotaxis protein
MRQIEDQLHQAQKLEAVGQLTGGIAHDFNNLLTAILGNLEMLGARLGAADQPLARLLAAASSAAERGARLTTQLLAFSRQQPMALATVDLDRLIAGMSSLLQTAIGATNRIKVVNSDRLSLALADPSQIELVILNLAINARDAMPGGGTITIGTAEVTVGAPEHLGEPPTGDYIMCSVSDTGTGIPIEILDKVFDPFFTTKEVGKGSGLGLSQVLGVVKQLGGGVRIETCLGKGTTVSVYLPRANERLISGTEVPTEPTAPCPDAGTANSRRGVVLLVDDDSEVRAATAEMLRYVGHDVIEAAGGREALDRLDRESDGVDLMIVDYVMPGMNGLEVARLGRLRRPGLPILFVTGFADTAVLVASASLCDGAHLARRPRHSIAILETSEHHRLIDQRGSDRGECRVADNRGAGRKRGRCSRIGRSSNGRHGPRCRWIYAFEAGSLRRHDVDRRCPARRGAGLVHSGRSGRKPVRSRFCRWRALSPLVAFRAGRFQ